MMLTKTPLLLYKFLGLQEMLHALLQVGLKMNSYTTGQEPKKALAIVELMLNHLTLGEVLLFAIEELLALKLLC